ncbi:hypothetical protein GDO86_004838 [Hymenochirus boettgeri]|uniref:G-protein coupled receptors family 1 profile domain-containing protein n=1 Tax=Hymenochirus boettgeri TaxID=247094 RepID=A0A8T2K982_9PIPI|nr:hypothetical protein GDO86_004838 [Hymenochirus boettgeri]
MSNSTVLYNNTSQVSFSKLAENVRTFLIFLLFLAIVLYLYCMAMILNVYFSTPHVRETVRYGLFAHMLVTDTLQLLIALVFYIAFTHSIKMPVPVCLGVVTFSTSSFLVTPFNLAAMSLERYIAICYPLSHVQYCTLNRCNAVISVMWGIGVTSIIAEFIAMSPSIEKSYYSSNAMCYWRTFIVNPTQRAIRTLTLVVSFTAVGLVIIFTYIKVTLVARKIGSNKSSAFKAAKTVILHALQLLLCMTSFMSPFVEEVLKEYFYFLGSVNFFLFMCLPRFISPLIYGLRDEVFRQPIRKLFTRNYKGDIK